jgi:Glycosyl transferase family 2
VTPPRRLLAPRPPYVLDRAPSPTFSVVIPAYEAAAFVASAVESALAQTLPPHEVIVSDDGSTDALAQALAPFMRRVTLMGGAHGGPAAARNRALRAATGDFIAALDADDAFHPQRLEALHALAVHRPDLDILATDAILDVDGTAVGRFNHSTPFPPDRQREAILSACFVCAPAIRRTRLVAIGGYDETLWSGEDWDALLRLALAGSAAGLVDEPLYTYRLRPGSVTSKRVAALGSRVQLLEKARTHPGLARDEQRILEVSIQLNRRRLLRAEAEVALISGGADRRRLALRLAAAAGTPARERVQAGLWAIGPRRAASALRVRSRALESAAPFRRSAR